MNTMQKEAILRDSHDNAETGQHQGQNKTYYKVSASYYWHGITEDINQWITHCPQCQRSNDVETKAPMMHPYIVTTPWTVIVINLTSLFPVSLQGNSHILTMTDLFTKWAIAEPIKIPTAYEVAEVVIKKLFEFGQVKRIITDQKMEFEDQVNEVIFEVFGVWKCLTSGYDSQAKELVNRTNNIIKRTLPKYCNAELNDWDEHLSTIMYAINTLKQGSMKATPFFYMFNRHPLLYEKVEAMQADIVIDNPEFGTVTKIAEVLPDNAGVLFNTEKAPVKQEPFEESHEKRKPLHFHEGEEVLLVNMKKEDHTCVESGWTGPFLVRNISSQGLVALADESGCVQKATVSRLKTCKHELDAGTKNVHTTDHDYSKKADVAVNDGDASV
ncbi:hypothetical protein R3I93_010599 [Phoxinus phoxinus]|uniref:Gypsy retrotransposon integrase-like protein 1 n=1 Tax=Phoxinus phoxinus TaxID=58324 RepID=A0AAN9CW04_9TELE